MTIEGFEVRASRFDQGGTITHLLAALEERGLSVFARVNHATSASAVGLQLAPTELFLVGNPKAGTALMQAGQTAAIDLPLRLPVWTDAQHQTRVGFDGPRWIAARHDIAAETNERTDMLARGLRAIAAAASGETQRRARKRKVDVDAVAGDCEFALGRPVTAAADQEMPASDPAV